MPRPTTRCYIYIMKTARLANCCMRAFKFLVLRYSRNVAFISRVLVWCLLCRKPAQGIINIMRKTSTHAPKLSLLISITSNKDDQALLTHPTLVAHENVSLQRCSLDALVVPIPSSAEPLYFLAHSQYHGRW